jgi:ubiquinone/menaquinone biosynthesis C-methylase UbiE
MLPAPLKSALFALHRSQIYEPRNRRVAEGVAQRIGRAASLLDVGCGDGNTAQRVAEMVGATDVQGVEVQIRPEQLIPIKEFDGNTLPFPDASFDAVMIADVLHHADNQAQLLKECVRVARNCVVVKDHFSFGPVSHQMLKWLDEAGNAAASVPVRARYFTMPEFVEMVTGAGAKVAALEWPFIIHSPPWRWIMPSELQFMARLEPTKA